MLRIKRFLFPTSALQCALALSLLAVSPAQTPSSYGNRQSPLNIVDTPSHPVHVDPRAPRFGNIAALKEPANFTVKNTTGSHWCKGDECPGDVDQRWGSLKAYPTAPVKITFGGESYSLVEFHFHAPAEHLVNSHLSAMEVHFVFAREGAVACSAGQLLVIGERIEPGAANSELNKIFGPDIPLPANYHDAPFDLKGFVPAGVLRGLHASYRYAGSLTAPAPLGCDDPPGNPIQQLASGHLPEVVSWVLLPTAITMSREQIARFAALFPNGDARSPQPLREQKITKAVQ
jgi:carbonic anhydrase